MCPLIYQIHIIIKRLRIIKSVPKLKLTFKNPDVNGIIVHFVGFLSVSK